MGKKGARRKTRWRTLSIGTPPGEEDEEEGSRNGYVKQGGEHGRERNGYGPTPTSWSKSWHGSTGVPRSNGQSNGSTTSGYGSAGSRSHRDDSSESRILQPKVMFNENEYTRISTPRQDVLFKKSYFSQRKPWASTTSMSATPSTTESQSASHSTADGSEAAEDQQLLDGAAGEFTAPVLEPAPQVTYGTYYDHANGCYYYEYPMMLMAPAIPEQLGPNIMTAMPEQIGPNILTAVPCAPVPLRPIEWMAPTYVPKVPSQRYCYMNYQAGTNTKCATLVDEHGVPLCASEPVPGSLEQTTDMGGETCSSISGNGSVAGEDVATNPDDEQPEDYVEQPPAGLPTEEQPETEQPLDQPLADYSAESAYVETLPAQPTPVHLAHVLPQPYHYPGQFMFGPPVVNVNGVTIQSGAMLRCSDMVASPAATAASVWAKRRRKKKKRKLTRPHALGNADDEDEEDYSAEEEDASCAGRVSWAPISSHPLNPECQEFQLRSSIERCVAAAEEDGPRDRPDSASPSPAAPDCHADDEPIRLTEERQPEALTNGSLNSSELSPLDDEEDEEEEEEEPPLCNHLEDAVDDLTQSLAASAIEEAPEPARKDGELDICEAWVKGSSLAPEACREESNKTAATLTETDTTTTTLTQQGTTDEDSGFESQSKLGPARPITAAVSEWLKCTNSSDLFITSSATSCEEDEDDEDYDEDEEDVAAQGNEPPKNLQGNPMPALSVKVAAGGREPSRGEFASLDEGGPTRRARKTGRRRRNERSRLHQREDAPASAEDPPEISVGTSNTGQDNEVTGTCELTANDSDASMRVAEKPRITEGLGEAATTAVDLTDKRIETTTKTTSTTTPKAVRTYEMGEIVVSLEGELLHVAREREPSAEEDNDLGSIEEPDVLECWEAETVEPVTSPRREPSAAYESASLAKENDDTLECVQRYYRLQEGASSEEEEQEEPHEGSESTTVPNSPGRASPENLVPEERPTSVTDDLSLPVDEAFEAYESFYTGKNLPFERPPIYPQLGKVRFFGRTGEDGPIPCKPVCCTIQ